MKVLPVVLIGLVLTVAAVAFFVPSQVFVDIGRGVSSLFNAKKSAEPVPVPPVELAPLTHAEPRAGGDGVVPAPLLAVETAITPATIDMTNKIIDTVKSGFGTLATLISILLGMKQLKPVQEKRKAAKRVAAPEPTKKTGMRVTSRPR